MIAIAGPNLPHEVLQAAGCHGGALGFDPDRAIGKSAQWLEAKFAPWTFCVLEAWIAGEYDDLDAVLFSRADDSSQRLYYYICELQRRGLLGGPEPLIFDIAKIPRESSLAHTALQLRKLADALGVKDDALEAAIKQSNRQRAAANHDKAHKACLLAGTPTPDRRLHLAAEQAGFTAFGPTQGEDWLSLGTPVAEGSDDPAMALCAKLHDDPRGSRSFVSSADLIAQDMAACGARAVVLWRIEEDEAQTWHLPAERRMLEASGVPHLVLTRRDWRAGDGAADEITSFLKGLNA